MIDYTEAQESAIDFRHMSKIRGWRYIWAKRSAPDAPLAVRAVAGEMIREFGELIEHLTEERQTVIDQLAAYDQSREALLADVHDEVARP